MKGFKLRQDSVRLAGAGGGRNDVVQHKDRDREACPVECKDHQEREKC